MSNTMKKKLTKRQREEAADRALARARSEYQDNGRIFIELLSETLDRSTHTIRQWLRREDFPDALKPTVEGGRKKMCWVDDQLEGLREYGEQRERLRGSFGRQSV